MKHIVLRWGPAVEFTTKVISSEMFLLSKIVMAR
jgi:hypothetical protein